MQECRDKIEGPFSVEEDLLFGGMITVGATVRAGKLLDLVGMITGDLDVERGARAIIRGMVNGTVRNHGGYVEISGAVDEVVDLSPEAETIVKHGAQIKGRHK